MIFLYFGHRLQRNIMFYLLLMNSFTLNEKVNRLKVVGYILNETNVRKTSFQFMMTICVFTSF